MGLWTFWLCHVDAVVDLLLLLCGCLLAIITTHAAQTGQIGHGTKKRGLHAKDLMRIDPTFLQIGANKIGRVQLQHLHGIDQGSKSNTGWFLGAAQVVIGHGHFRLNLGQCH